MTDPITPTGKRQHAEAWGDWEPEPRSAANGHGNDPSDCSACRAILAIEREAAAGLVNITREDDGSISISLTVMPGHIGAGMTWEEATANAKDAAGAWLDAKEQMAREATDDGFWADVDTLAAAIRDAAHFNWLVGKDTILLDPYRTNAEAIIQAAKEE